MLYWLGRDKAVTWILSGLFVGGGGGGMFTIFAHLCTIVHVCSIILIHCIVEIICIYIWHQFLKIHVYHIHFVKNFDATYKSIILS